MPGLITDLFDAIESLNVLIGSLETRLEPVFVAVPTDPVPTPSENALAELPARIQEATSGLRLNNRRLNALLNGLQL